ncbi:MAG: hypothetical protein ACFFFC_14095, partial [Candidatus Thorarchaeota archaeon]
TPSEFSRKPVRLCHFMVKINVVKGKCTVESYSGAKVKYDSQRESNNSYELVEPVLVRFV